MAYFKNSYQYKWSNTADISALPLYQNAAESKTISFSTPILHCRGCLTSGGSWSDLFEMNVKTTVYREQTRKVEFLQTGMYRYEIVPNTREVYRTFNSGATSISSANNAVYYASDGKAYLRRIRSASNNASDNTSTAGSWSDYYTTTSVLAQAVSGTNSRTISFTIPALTAAEIEAGKGYVYTIECEASPVNTNAMLSYYEAVQSGTHRLVPVGLLSVNYYTYDIYTKTATVVDASSVKIRTMFYHQDFSVVTSGGVLITKGVKYSCYNLLRKALLTCDTHVINNNTTSLDEYNNNGQPMPSLQHCIILDDDWNNRLKTAKMQETVFEGKNLWEVMLQIGYYIHAIPYLEFAKDGTDRFVLSFRQLGGTKTKEDGVKLTVFNSRNLTEFFTQYDSYVTNLFSPQNVVEEWVVPKTSDSTFLVSNNTSELKLSYAITELVEFDIQMRLPNGVWDTRSAIENVFEKSIYDILSNDNPYQVYPCKGAALYYTLGSNKIEGLNFVPPCQNTGDLPMALKRILQILWQGTTIADVNSMKFNDLRFRVKYRTQDTARVTQIRPDLCDFMKNSSLEKYPHHEQFYGQQDKIIDSERFSANLFGRLIRVGNAVYQRQEYATPSSEKESGDLVTIDGDNYYVTATENEFYPDIILQKVTYSKNFNQLSNIVTIPSEPRFYEVSERSKVRREVRIMEFLELSTTRPTKKTARFLNDGYGWTALINLLFNTGAVLPNYAWTRFKADKLRTHENGAGIVLSPTSLFPSSLLDRSSPNAVTPQTPSDHADCIVPLLHFPLHDGIVFAWDMDDNFKAGDFVDPYLYYTNKPNDEAYLSMQPFRYVDIMGRADLFSFKLFDKRTWTPTEIQKLPQASGITITNGLGTFASVKGGDSMGIALDKDCREEISFNYQINLLHRPTATDREDFITFPNLFGAKDSRLKMCFLNETQSMFNENVSLTPADIVADNVTYSATYNSKYGAIEIRITPSSGINMGDVKAIVLYQESTSGATDGRGRYAYIVKNVSKQSNSNKTKSWWIYPVYND